MVCSHCGLEVIREHGYPWQCIGALRHRLDMHESGQMAIIEHIRQMVYEPTDDGRERISDPGEKRYWMDILDRRRKVILEPLL